MSPQGDQGGGRRWVRRANRQSLPEYPGGRRRRRYEDGGLLLSLVRRSAVWRHGVVIAAPPPPPAPWESPVGNAKGLYTIPSCTTPSSSLTPGEVLSPARRNGDGVASPRDEWTRAKTRTRRNDGGGRADKVHPVALLSAQWRRQNEKWRNSRTGIGASMRNSKVYRLN